MPIWLQHWFAIQSPGQDIAGDLDHSWPWATWFTILFAAAAVAFVSLVYATEPGSAGRRMRTFLGMLRLASITVLLAMIAQWALSLNRMGQPTVVLLIDDSASMSTIDPADDAQSASVNARLRGIELDQPTRLNLAKTLLLEDHRKLLAQIASRYKIGRAHV